MQIEQQSGSSPELDDEATQVVEESGKPGETEDSLLSVVQSVVEQSNAQSTQDSDTDSPTEEQGQQAAHEQADGQQADDFSKLPFNKHPRFRELVKEKNTYKAQMAGYEADAKQYRDIQSFMQTNSLTAQEVVEGFEIMAQMKSDPAKAREALLKRMELLELATGHKLPTDLEEKIDQGYIDRETARDLHQQRVGAERKAQLAQSQLDRRSQEDQRNQVNSMASAVSAWEQATKSSDPDFDLKAELVKDRVRAHVASNGMPRTAEEALKLSKDSYDAVTQTLLRVRGDKAPMRTTVGGKTNGSAAPEPKNLLDVIRRVSAGA
jgi:hypothetical protein